MKNTIKLLLCFLVVSLFVGVQAEVLSAQTATTVTFITGAINNRATSFTVNSATGFTASTNSVGQYAYIDKEAFKITAVSGTTITISGGQFSTNRQQHLANALVFAGPQAAFINGPDEPSGSCTRGNYTYLPMIHVLTGKAFDCILSTTATTSNWSAVLMVPQFSVRPYNKLPTTATTYTALITDEIIGYNTATPGTITLPVIKGLAGKTYLIKQEVTGIVGLTINAGSGQTINGASSITVAGTNFAGTQVYFDGVSKWFTFTNTVN